MKDKQPKTVVKKKSKKQLAVEKAKAFAKLKRTSVVGSVQMQILLLFIITGMLMGSMMGVKGR